MAANHQTLTSLSPCKLYLSEELSRNTYATSPFWDCKGNPFSSNQQIFFPINLKKIYPTTKQKRTKPNHKNWTAKIRPKFQIQTIKQENYLKKIITEKRNYKRNTKDILYSLFFEIIHLKQMHFSENYNVFSNADAKIGVFFETTKTKCFFF